MEVKKVVWDKEALLELETIFYFLKTNSKNTKIIPTLVKMCHLLSIESEIYSLDRFKIENDGTYRAFEKFHYRISYKIHGDEIRILRVRHTSRNPIEF